MTKSVRTLACKIQRPPPALPLLSRFDCLSPEISPANWSRAPALRPSESKALNFMAPPPAPPPTANSAVHQFREQLESSLLEKPRALWGRGSSPDGSLAVRRDLAFNWWFSGTRESDWPADKGVAPLFVADGPLKRAVLLRRPRCGACRAGKTSRLLACRWGMLRVGDVFRIFCDSVYFLRLILIYYFR